MKKFLSSSCYAILIGMISSSTPLCAAQTFTMPVKEQIACKTEQKKGEIAISESPEIKKEIDQTDTFAIPLDSSEAEEAGEIAQLKEIQATKRAKKGMKEACSTSKLRPNQK